jgi:hypothetical protein
MMVVGQMDLGMDLEFIDLPMVMFMMVVGQMDLGMDLEFIDLPMEEFMLGHGVTA